LPSIYASGRKKKNSSLKMAALQGRLTRQQTRALEQHLQEKTYLKVSDICGYVAQTWGVSYTVSGMTKWLQTHGFRYKQPKGTPAKADLRQQEAFIEAYLQLLEDTQLHDPILFIDAVHPTMATKISCGWIKRREQAYRDNRLQNPRQHHRRNRT
jgi:transposase